MNTARKLNLRERSKLALLARRRTLMRRYAEEARTARELYDEREPDWEDRAQLVTAASDLERLSEADRAQLARVEAAIERLDDGTWGWCLVCGAPIEDARLVAVPEAARCSGCTDHE
jgi:RNA polymerase-binding transcription factor DksA